MEGTSGGHKLLARLTGMFLTAMFWPINTNKNLKMLSHSDHEQPQARLSSCPSAPVCPGKPHPWDSSSVHRQIFKGIYLFKVAKMSFVVQALEEFTEIPQLFDLGA